MSVFKNDNVSCTIHVDLSQGTIHISGTVNSPNDFQNMLLIAACPMNRMTSYSGSGLPFPCPAVAFENTPNKTVIPSTGIFNATYSYPNSYYTNDNLEKIPPSLFFTLHPRSGDEPIVIRIGLQDRAPLRTLTHRPARTGPEFYARKDSLIAPQTAEGVMRTLKDYKVTHSIA